MRLHRFFIDTAIDTASVNTLSNEGLAHQLRSVFRFHEGSSLIFFDGMGVDYVSEIVSLTRSEVTFRVIETRPVKQAAKLKLCLAFSLIKKANVEWIVEKGTELGVTSFIPLISERSEKKGLDVARLQRIITEACEQSGRAELPTIGEPQKLEDFLKDADNLFILHTDSGEAYSKNTIPGEGEATVCIGPEGGWTEKEISAFKEKGAKIIHLDTPVLRAETAAIVASALFLL